jgi:serine/threonine-protein kinase
MNWRKTMDTERWRQVEGLFHRATELAPKERPSFLDDACRDDAELRRQVEGLLAADARSHARIERMEQGVTRLGEDPLIGHDVGTYRLIERVAIGGMGVVYRARRSDGLFEQEVAIKLIRTELVSESLIRRFEFERRTLAALQHPNIAHMYDGGTTPEGRPYLVMEFVRGVPIDQYCDGKSFSIDQRLRLFVAACRAVHFAHQNLIVHRDIKPGNILVDERGAPKLLDFGIARILDDADGKEGSEPTRTGGQILTPEYASPEQLTGGAVTTAIDVYSLGIVLYELLTGHKPHRSDSRSPLDWQRAVLERTPTRPSDIVSAVPDPLPTDALLPPTAEELAGRRGMEPSSLRRRLRGDLDRIVLMALRKEPERRYASVKDMADDIERHFSGHPVIARADSVAYRTQRFVQRNRLAVASGVAVLAALLFGLVATRRGEVRAQAQAEHARIEAESFEGISNFLMNTFLASVNTLDAAELAAKRQRIRLHAEQLRRKYEGQEHLRANLLDSLGRVAQRLSLFEDAELLIHEALVIRTRAFGPESLEYALSMRSVGLLRYARGELVLAAEALEKALMLHRTRPRETHTDIAAVANDLAACWRGLGRLDDAEALQREALGLRRAAADGSLEVAESANNLAQVELDKGATDAARVLLEEALAIRRRILGPEDPLTLQALSNLASTHWRLGRRDEALALLGEVEAGCRALHADGDEGLAQALSNRAVMLITSRKYAEADAALTEALELQIRRLGPTHSAVASTLTKCARLQALAGRPEDARATWSRVIALRRGASQSPRYLGQALCEYGEFLLDAKAPDEARGALEESVLVLETCGARNTPACSRAESSLGEVLLALGRPTEAETHLKVAVAILDALPGSDEAERQRVQELLARCGTPAIR